MLFIRGAKQLNLTLQRTSASYKCACATYGVTVVCDTDGPVDLTLVILCTFTVISWYRRSHFRNAECFCGGICRHNSIENDYCGSKPGLSPPPLILTDKSIAAENSATLKGQKLLKWLKTKNQCFALISDSFTERAVRLDFLIFWRG